MKKTNYYSLAFSPTTQMRRVLMLTAALPFWALSLAEPAAADTTNAATIAVPSGSLDRALMEIGRQSGLHISYQSALTRDAQRVEGFADADSADTALRRVLSGSGLTYHFTGDRTVLIQRMAQVSRGRNDDGAYELAPIVVTSDVGDGNSNRKTPYFTPAPMAHIASEEMDRFRGSDAGDIFRGTPGVISGEARNGAGGLSVNIRGLQGMGRVKVEIDGATNAVEVPQGYQGYSDRTFVDPDFIAGVDISKGSEAASNGMVGTVRMRTLDAGDVVKDGKRFGFRLKGGFGTNTSSSTADTMGGYKFPGSASEPAVAIPSPTGMDRPGLLDPTQGHGSAVAAFKGDQFEALIGYARRERGNYHAGTNGPAANPYIVENKEVCGWWCQTWPQYVEVGGLANYRAGEEVLNTELETQSLLAKTAYRFGNGHQVKFSYNWFESEAGDRMASRMQIPRSEPVQMEHTSLTRVNTYNFNYNWKPSDSGIWDLEARVFLTELNQRQAWNRSGWPLKKPSDFGLSDDFRIGSDVTTWGATLKNTSRFSTGRGDLKLEYGLSHQNESISPSDYTTEIIGPYYAHGEKQESAAYIQAEWEALDWLTLTGGLRYSRYEIEDTRPKEPNVWVESVGARSGGGFSNSLGATIAVSPNTEVWGRYSISRRSPSFMESASSATGIGYYDFSLEEEKARNWDFGINHRMSDVFSGGDRALLKLSLFDWTIDNYTARGYLETPEGYFSMGMYNLDKAKFQGAEISAIYENRGLTAELAANYYTDVKFCPKESGCAGQSLYGDFGTNQVPPEYSIGLTLSHKFLDDRLTLGGRINHTGPRAAGHSNVTAQGAGQFISLIKWDPYTMVDVFAEYKIRDNVTGIFRIENLTDQYYVDPLSTVQQPGPGRTLYVAVKAEF